MNRNYSSFLVQCYSRPLYLGGQVPIREGRESISDMSTNAKILRNYQAQLITDFNRCWSTDTGARRRPGDILVEQPTGSGKTLEIVTLIAMNLGARFTHAIIAAPQIQIEAEFAKRDYNQIVFPNDQLASPNGLTVAAPRSLIQLVRETKDGQSTSKALVRYLKSKKTAHALACTHSTLTNIIPDDLPQDLTGCALFVDEAHHAPAKGLRTLVKAWRQRGGQVYFFTATPYRSDGHKVALKGMKVLRRSLAQHMDEHDTNGITFAPKHLHSQIVPIGVEDDGVEVNAKQFAGVAPPPAAYTDQLLGDVCEQWVQDGRPKTIIRVPGMRGGSSWFVKQLVDCLQSRGARVFDSTGDGPEQQVKFLEMLKSEQDIKSYADSEVDVIVGIQRVLEGTNWPICSHVYSIGMPGSLTTVVQFIGRSNRNKYWLPDYPVEFKDDAHVTFFVPCGNGALKKLSLGHSKHALLTACYLADHETGSEWVVQNISRSGIRRGVKQRQPVDGVPVIVPTESDIANVLNKPIDPEVRARVTFALCDAREQLRRDDKLVTPDAMLKIAEPLLREVPGFVSVDKPEGAVDRILGETAATDPAAGPAVRKVLKRQMAKLPGRVQKRMRGRKDGSVDPTIRKEQRQAFRILVNIFRNETLESPPVLAVLSAQVHKITGGQAIELANRMRNALSAPLTDETIRQWVDEFIATSGGKLPTAKSGVVPDSGGQTWSGIDTALNIGGRGLPGDSTLADWLVRNGYKEIYRVRNNLPPLDDAQIREWVDAFIAANDGKLPTVKSGVVPDSGGQTWRGIDAALINGGRGLPGDSSLTDWLVRNGYKQPYRVTNNLPPLDDAQIREWVETYRLNNGGKLPTKDSGVIPNSGGQTWSGLNTALMKGLRGLPGGSSLANWLVRNGYKQPYRNTSNLPSLDDAQIREWVETYRLNQRRHTNRLNSLLVANSRRPRPGPPPTPPPHAPTRPAPAPPRPPKRQAPVARRAGRVRLPWSPARS